MSSKSPPDIRAREWVAPKSVNSPLLVVLVAGFTTLTFLASSFLAGKTGSLDFAFSRRDPDYNNIPPVNAQKEILNRCAALKATPVVPQAFYSRKESERYEYGNNATLIRGASIFTGRESGREIVHGNLLLDRGTIRGMGKIPARTIEQAENLTVIEAHGAWVTPGLSESSSMRVSKTRYF